jgi:Mce-associated membrane protein
VSAAVESANADPDAPSVEVDDGAERPQDRAGTRKDQHAWWYRARRRKNADSDAGRDPSDDVAEKAGDADTADESTRPARRAHFAKAMIFAGIPILAMALALGAAYLQFVVSSARQAERASVESVQAAKDSTVAMLSYTPDTADKNLTAASDRMTGAFRDSYSSLIHDVVIPGAKEKKVTTVATIPAAASLSATATHAVVLVYVNQATTMGDGAPTQTNSVVQVTLDKPADRWLISGFDPK